jgi:hypothetical protein
MNRVVIGVSLERGRWAVDLGGVLVRRKTLTGTRHTPRMAAGRVRHWRRCLPAPIQPYAWERP